MKSVNLSLEEATEMLNTKGMVSFEYFSNSESLKKAHKWLEHFLKEAKDEFSKIIKTSQESASYYSVVFPYLTSGKRLGILYSFIDTLNSVCASDATREIIEEFEPKIVAFSNEVLLNERFYNLLGVALKRCKSADEKRSLTLLLKEMEHAGVKLSDDKRKLVSRINKRMSLLSQRFENNVIDSRKIFSHHIEDELVLGFMPEADKAEAREQARLKKKDGFVFTLLPPQYASIMKYCTDRRVRQGFYDENNNIATNGKTDNRKLIIEMLRLRQQKAKLLGSKNFAEYTLELRMAKNPKNVFPLLDRVFKKAAPAARSEIGDLKLFAEKSKWPIKEGSFAEWDLGFYSDLYKRQHFAFDEAKLREYFELGRVIEGLFAVSKKLYDLSFKEIKSGIYEEGVRVFEVYKAGKMISYYIADFYARPTKRGGAWCNVLREGYVYSAEKTPHSSIPIVINVMNFSKPTKEHPALLMHRDVETLFHEFGHAVHAMLSSNQLPNLNGFHVEWDFVEFPSQIFENWTWESEVLNLFARHYETNELIPKKDLATLWKLKTFLGGYHVVRQNEFGYLDMKLHTDSPPKTVKSLDKVALKIVRSRTILKKKENYRMYASFGHIFAGGYSAGYYSYLWAEILEADCYEFLKSRGILSTKTGQLFASHILAPGTREPGEKLFTGLLNRKPKIEPLLKKYGIS